MIKPIQSSITKNSDNTQTQEELNQVFQEVDFANLNREIARLNEERERFRIEQQLSNLEPVGSNSITNVPADSNSISQLSTQNPARDTENRSVMELNAEEIQIALMRATIQESLQASNRKNLERALNPEEADIQQIQEELNKAFNQ